MGSQPFHYQVRITVSASGAVVVISSQEGEILQEEQYTAREWDLVRYAMGGQEEQARECLAAFAVHKMIARHRHQAQARREALERRLQEAIDEEDYELAAHLRDQLAGLGGEVPGK